MQQNLDISTLPPGSVACYNVTYATSTNTVDINGCTGSQYLLVGGFSAGSPNTLLVAAVGLSSAVLTTTSSLGTATTNENGLFWYFYPGHSFGFADDSVLLLGNADGSSISSNTRVSWHLDLSIGGYRLGNLIDLFSGTTPYKIIIKLAACPAVGCLKCHLN